MSSSSNSSTSNNTMGTGASSKLGGKSSNLNSGSEQLASNNESASKLASCSSSLSSISSASSMQPQAQSQQQQHQNRSAQSSATNLQQQQLQPSQAHSCEICGVSGLSDDLMRDHTRQCHVEGNAQCPFCGLSGIAAAELLLHVNQAHLDYLTPENELMSFIDDQTPSVDGDSDSMSECRGLSPSITEIPGIITNHNSNNNHRNCNGYSNNYSKPTQNGNSSSANVKMNGNLKSLNRNCNGGAASSTKMSNGSVKEMSISMTSSTGSTSSSSSTSKFIANDHQLNNLNNNNNNNNLNNNNYDNLSSNNCDMNYGLNGELSNGLNGGEQSQPQQHGEGSPLRSQLGLKLKANKPKIITTTPIAQTSSNNLGAMNSNSKQSPLQCLLCPYKTENAQILEEHINRSHFDPLSPSVNGQHQQHQQNHSQNNQSNHVSTLDALQCPICVRCFESCSDLELHVNIEHRDILSPAKIDHQQSEAAANGLNGECSLSCPVCAFSFENMKTQEMELHIEKHFAKSPSVNQEPDLEKQAQKLREQREFEMLRAQYGMDDQGNFREQSAAAMQRAVYAGEMSVADYYERQVGLRAAESHGVDDGSSCTKSVAARVLSLSSSSPGVIKSFVCSGVDHYASSYGDKGWGCGYRNLQMMLSSLLQNTCYNEAIYSAWGNTGNVPARTAMPSISRLQKMVEAAWAQGFDVQGKEQLGCKLYNTRKWIGATEIVTVLSWLRIQCQLVDFHKPTASDGRHPDLFNWVLRYFEEPKIHTPPLYLQHQGHSRTIIGIEQKSSGLTLLVLDPSHGPRQVAALGSSQDSLRLIRRGPNAMKAPQYQIVAVRGLIETEEEYQASKVLKSLRIPPDR